MSSDIDWADAMAARTRVRDALRKLQHESLPDVVMVVMDLEAADDFITRVIDRLEVER